MQKIKKTILISAPAEKVFFLIEKFEEIPRFSSAISEVSCESDDISLWRVEVGGIALDWRAELLEKKPPIKISWRSISGLRNNGGFELEQINGKTRVNFYMEYQLPSRILESTTHLVIDKLIEDIYSEILTNIKKELENKVEEIAPR